MRRTDKMFMKDRSSAVRLPNSFQSSTAEVLIRKQGDDVTPAAWPGDWTVYLDSAPTASEQFMEGVEDLPVQERTILEYCADENF
jgi:virulence-associated protein VagC